MIVEADRHALKPKPEDYHSEVSQVHTPEEEPATSCSRPGRDPLGFLGTLEHHIIDLL